MILWRGQTYDVKSADCVPRMLAKREHCVIGPQRTILVDHSVFKAFLRDGVAALRCIGTMHTPGCGVSFVDFSDAQPVEGK